MFYEDAVFYAKDAVKNYPQLEDSIKDSLVLCKCEIEEGESEDHEVDLFIGRVEELVEELVEESQ